MARRDGKNGDDWWPWAAAGAALAAGWALARPVGRLASRGVEAAVRAGVNRVADTTFHRLFADPMGESLWELVAPTRRVGPQTIAEMEFRARQWESIDRPLGPIRRRSPWQDLVFTPAQPPRWATPLDEPVGMDVRIGPAADRPLELEIPILLGGMAYGLGLSKRAKLALALGATLAGTATNTGEGPFLPEERAAARRLVVQVHRGRWGWSREGVRQADMVEISFGQAAYGGAAHVIEPRQIDRRLRRALGLAEGEPAVVEARHPEVASPGDLRRLGDRLRELSGGVPIAAKVAATHRLEETLEFLVEGGVDAVSLDGADGATKAAPPILQDAFGLPTLYAVARARAALDRMGAGRRVTLLAGGGLYAPADFLKALALGADACYIGTMALWALTHTQVTQATPWEPPTQLVFYGGKLAHKLRVRPAAWSLARFLRSSADEMRQGVRALGKDHVRQVGREDLVALSRALADALGLPHAARPPGGEPTPRGGPGGAVTS